LSVNGEDTTKFIKEFEKEFESILQSQVKEVHGQLMDAFTGINKNVRILNETDPSKLNYS
jgi:hypothetical protein